MEQKDATVAQSDEIARTTLGQRRVNLIWEVTQSFIALSVIGTFLYVCSSIALSKDDETTAFVVMTNVASLVIGFYFGRSNHQRIGGVDQGR